MIIDFKRIIIIIIDFILHLYKTKIKINMYTMFPFGSKGGKIYTHIADKQGTGRRRFMLLL